MVTDSMGGGREAGGARRSRRILNATGALIIPVLFFGLLEGGLRLMDYGDDLPLFTEVPGFSHYLRPDPAVAYRYFAGTSVVPAPPAEAFRREKTGGTFRVFVQGGSTAAGFPYGHAASFPRMLRQRLSLAFPSLDVEVVNTAMAAVGSHTLRDFVDEIVEQEPDAVLVYAGHNEYYGALGVGSTESMGEAGWLVRLYLVLDRFRIVQALRDLWTGILAPTTGHDQNSGAAGVTLMEEMARDREISLDSPRYLRGLRQFRDNMTAALCRYRAERIPVFVGTVASNERDQPPFVSGLAAGTDTTAWERAYEEAERRVRAGGPDEARRAVDALLDLDDRSARAHYLNGLLLLREDHLHKARAAFLRAKDLDLLRFRAPEDINLALREVAGECGSIVVDSQARLASAAEDGIVGREVMLEHLHPNVEGYLLIADAFYKALVDASLPGESPEAVPLEVARREVLVTALDSALASLHVRRLRNNWPFQRLGVTRPDTFVVASFVDELALEVLRGNRTWSDATAQLGAWHESGGRLQEALRVALALASEEPYRAAPYLLGANLLARMHRFGDAHRMFRLADEREPSLEARRGMGQSLMRLGRSADAVDQFRRALSLDAPDEATRYDLALALALSGRPDEARTVAESLLHDVTGHPGAARLVERLDAEGER